MQRRLYSSRQRHWQHGQPIKQANLKHSKKAFKWIRRSEQLCSELLPAYWRGTVDRGFGWFQHILILVWQHFGQNVERGGSNGFDVVIPGKVWCGLVRHRDIYAQELSPLNRTPACVERTRWILFSFFLVKWISLQFDFLMTSSILCTIC